MTESANRLRPGRLRNLWRPRGPGAGARTKLPGSGGRAAGEDRRNFAHRIGADFRESKDGSVEAVRKAIDGSFLVIHGAGPFQGADYRVAETCIEIGAHYLDLADARDFVAGIGRLDAAASERGLLVASGVSSTPAITSALINELAPEFSQIDSIYTALSPGNQNPRGEATIAAVLSYLGHTIRFWQDGRWTQRQGWGDARRLEFPPPVGRRRVHNCEVPELELYPELFHARTVQFAAGLELNLLNYMLSVCSVLARWLKIDFTRHARFFLNASLMLFPLGTTNGALAIWLKGRDREGRSIERKIALVTDFDGPATPSSAAIILARKLLRNGPPRVGAFPCVGLLSLEELLEHLRPLGIWCAAGRRAPLENARGESRALELTAAACCTCVCEAIEGMILTERAELIDDEHDVKEPAMKTPGARLREAWSREPIMIPGAFNALVAKQAERLGFAAVYLSGGALAAGWAGLPDVGLLSQTEFAEQAAVLARATSLPVLCDADTGFGEAVNVERTVRLYEEAGVAGLHLEDQTLPKRCGHLSGKMLIDSASMAAKIRAAGNRAATGTL